MENDWRCVQKDKINLIWIVPWQNLAISAMFCELAYNMWYLSISFAQILSLENSGQICYHILELFKFYAMLAQNDIYLTGIRIITSSWYGQKRSLAGLCLYGKSGNPIFWLILQFSFFASSCLDFFLFGFILGKTVHEFFIIPRSSSIRLYVIPARFNWVAVLNHRWGLRFLRRLILGLLFFYVICNCYL